MDRVKVESCDEVVFDVDRDIVERIPGIQEKLGQFGNQIEIFLNGEPTVKTIKIEKLGSDALDKVFVWVQHEKDIEKEPKPNYTQVDVQQLQLSEWEKSFFDVGQDELFNIIMAAIHLRVQSLLEMAMVYRAMTLCEN